jgi:hypothetical protein
MSRSSYVVSFLLHFRIKLYIHLYFHSYVTELSNPLNVRRRLKRQWPSDLKDQREEEE